MPIHHAYAQHRTVYDQDGRPIRTFANAEQASAYAMQVIAGEVVAERRAA